MQTLYRPLRALDVADFFIEISDGTMTPCCLNRLVYLAQAWSLEKLGRPLFEEEAEARACGPVIPSVCRTYSGCDIVKSKR